MKLLRGTTLLLLAVTICFRVAVGSSLVRGSEEAPVRAPEAATSDGSDGASESHPVSLTMTEVVLKEGEENVAGSVPKEGTLYVRIPGNPTTGYVWKVDEKCPLKLFEAKGRKFLQPESAEKGPMVGVGGTYVFAFKALDEGEETICFQEKRPWEGGEIGGSANVTMVITPADVDFTVA